MKLMTSFRACSAATNHSRWNCAMDFNLFESGFLMNWAGMALRGVLIAAIGAIIVWGLVDRRVRHIAALTWKTAFRLRFVWVMILLLVLAVGGLPAVLRDDGSPKGMAQIILTYTLGMTTGILGFATLWLSVGSMAHEIGQCQMQMVAIKPIARWQIWLGKWLGIMGLNLLLLGLSGGVVYGMMEYRANALGAAQHKLLKDRSDREIFEMVNAAITRGEISVDQVIQKDPDTQGPMRDKGGNMVPHPMEKLKQLLAGIPEKILRDQVLVSRAPLQLEDVQMMSFTNNEGVSYRNWQKLRREQDEERALAMALVNTRKNAIARNHQQVPTALPPEIQQSIREAVRLQYAVFSQLVGPQMGRRFVYRKPLGSFDEDRGLVLRFQLEDSRMSFKSDRKYRVVLRYSRDGKGEGFPPLGREYVARTPINEPLMAVGYSAPEGGAKPGAEMDRVSIFGPDNLMYVDLYNAEQPQQGQEYLAVIRLPFVDDRTGKLNPRGVEVMYYEGGFLKNYLRALAIVFAWLGVLAALGLAAASFMSFPMAVFACTGILVISFCTGIMKDVVADDTVMQTWTDGKRDSSVVDFFAVQSFRLMVSVISPVKDYSPIDDLTDGRAVTWGQLARAYGYIWGISGLLISACGALIFSRRQLAITDSDE